MIQHMAWILAVLMGLMSAGRAGSSVSISDNQGLAAIPCEKGPLLVYKFRDVPRKSYVLRLCSPSGVNVVRDHVPDHAHHHGLMLAWKVNPVNFWAEEPECGFEVSKKVDPVGPQAQGLAYQGGFVDTLVWQDAQKRKTILGETRMIQAVLDSDLGATVVTWTSELKAPVGDANAVLAGDHYHGLGMRFVESMDSTGTFVTSNGQQGTVFRGEERLVEADWCAYAALVDGKPVTVAMFDHPANPRPATWFTMKTPFAYLSATMRTHEKPLQVQAGRTLWLRYGIAVWDGTQDRSVIQRTYEKWLASHKEDTQSVTGGKP
jgi:hypothetical protein